MGGSLEPEAMYTLLSSSRPEPRKKGSQRSSSIVLCLQPEVLTSKMILDNSLYLSGPQFLIFYMRVLWLSQTLPHATPVGLSCQDQQPQDAKRY